AQARAAIRDCLPLSANRFARWKWILPIIATLQFFYFVLQLWRRQRGF
ncbi:MAG: hypothetical protein JO089_09360, partial [Alphaproteobacteria bacterium]|nr:hypothetical protein [Alphaproteobacteria bacterium]